ncbi:GntR family transcriptional regulator [Listeria monocytogenes]|uniref:GntR family transcriptional regulator n=1 Tax=Listeria monocytogenes TaxID=1639 RepID=UPI0010791A6A|nr:GntR family transcriptional regulator [Listeria monocytogenes]EAA0136668.1 GntR family transcriptional regulator [Listeria monocytogenes]EAD3681452.1 GntR family transcriptional regulator [Listeria monocytogenes]EAD3698159.1 GntR family transcriptional regulator [Listeria monocytogenes]MDA5983459.1 GntR family transcriptional regulator [Listeria monocytogenes]HAB7538277.1 GntR family transcriptional regulator [Listeria monocytogenes]
MEKQTYEKLAYYTIKEKILSGKLHVRQHISEAGIAKELSISRTPVRKAIAVLVSEELIEYELNRGAIVIESSMSAGRFIELLEMAEILVVQTIEKCKNKNLTYKPEQGNALLEEMREIQKEEDVEAYLSLLSKWLLQFVAQLANSYAEDIVRKMKRDFFNKAQKDIKIIPVLLEEETMETLEQLTYYMVEKKHDLAKEVIQKLMNLYIIRTFR